MKSAFYNIFHLLILLIVVLGLVLFFCRLPQTEVEIFVDIPDGLEEFAGNVPVTFGIPFEDGALSSSDKIKIIDGEDDQVPAQFEVTSRWPSGNVRWILVDMLVDITDGEVGQYFFCAKRGGRSPTRYDPMDVDRSRTEISIHTGGQSFVMNETNESMGHFVLSSTSGTTSKDFSAGPNGNYKLSLETHGSVRTVAKMTGQYTASDGTTRGQFITRVRAYAGLPYVRVYHTLIWDEDDTPTIDSFQYLPTEVPANGRAAIGIDDTMVGPALSMAYRQDDWNDVHDGSASSVGTHLDGWIQVEGTNDSLFAGVRWPWQQFPLQFSFSSGRLSVNLIQPEPSSSMSLAANDVVVAELIDYDEQHWDLTTNSGPYPNLSPRGVGKTYEILIWRDDDTTPQDVKNILLQHPVYAYPDPEYATKADLPTPVSPIDTTNFAPLEAAIENSFDWLTRENAEYGDFGIWNYGDVQYDWSAVQPPAVVDRFRKDRYWMNSGKGFSSVPWLLYIRSGDRKYLEFAEANARHVMDVDTSHITNESELKFKGGTSRYNPVHFGAHTYPIHYATESAYLVSYYHMTGYERAKDVIQERVDAVKTSNSSYIIEDVKEMLNFLATDHTYPTGITADNETVVNGSYYASLGEIAVLYEATQDATLKSYADEFIDLFLAAQASNGYVAGTKTNNWFARAMDHAQRAFPDRRTELRDYLEAWWGSVGSYKALSTTGESAVDVMSLWTMLIVAEHANDSSLIDLAVEYARTGALGVYDDDGDWIGYSNIPRHELTTVIEDWVAAIDAANDAGPSNVSQNYVPMNNFNAGLVTDTQDVSIWAGRHVFYVLEETDQDFTVNISFNQRNAGFINEGKIRIFAPDETETEIERVIETRTPGNFHDYPNYPSFPQPYTLEGISNYQASFEIEIESDGQTGAYAIEVLNGKKNSALQLPVYAKSSTGKLVHYMPQYSRRAEFVAPCILYNHFKQQLPSMSNGMGWGGQAFFKPKSTSTPVEFAFGLAIHEGGAPSLPKVPTLPGANVRPALYKNVPRIVGLDPSGSTVCASSITGTSTDGYDNPEATSCSFTPNTTDLHSVVLLNQDWHMDFFLDGVEPWWSGEASTWFDPTAHTHPDPEQFLIPPPVDPENIPCKCRVTNLCKVPVIK